MKANGKSRLGILVAVVILLFTALAVGIGIKLYQPHRAEFGSQVGQQQTKPAETRPKEDIKLSEMTPEDEEFLLWLDEEIKRLEEETETIPDEEDMYVSEEQAEVSSLKESVSRAELQTAVAKGRMFEENAKTKVGDWGEKAKTDTYLKEVWAELQAAVAEGRMSEEDAKAEMTAIKKDVSAKTKADYQVEKAKADYQVEKVETDAYLK